MVFVRLAYFPGGTLAHHSALARVIGKPAEPEDRVFFAAGPVTGGWQVVQPWRSRSDLDTFNRRVLLPAYQRLGRSPFPAEPQVTDVEAVEPAGLAS